MDDLFTHLQHWQRDTKIRKVDAFVDPDDPLYSLFAHCYKKTELLYKRMGPRRNGESPFVHPSNVTWNLKHAGINDPVTLCIGMFHDFVEEEVDLFKAEQKISLTPAGIKKLDAYEATCLQNLETDLTNFCTRAGYPTVAQQIIDPVAVLTRHKRHFYYESIGSIFDTKDRLTKIRAIQVKLADRTHNILCIESFTDQERIYQCFKNLFILNNTKEFLLTYLDLNQPFHLQSSSTEKLFNKCCKATYDAFLTICILSRKKGIDSVCSMLQLAFKKFAFEIEGIWEVTELRKEEQHPMRLFQGIIRKWDARLHHEWEKFDAACSDEIAYCRTFFAPFKFTDEQLSAVVIYKDAYAIKEAVAQLLYSKDYFLNGFRVKELVSGGRIPHSG